MSININFEYSEFRLFGYCFALKNVAQRNKELQRREVITTTTTREVTGTYVMSLVTRMFNLAAHVQKQGSSV